MTSTTASSGTYPFDAGPFGNWSWPLDALAPSTDEAGRRATRLALVAWLPLVLLAGAQGLLDNPNPRESFFQDVAAHARYLVALPVLIIAQAAALPRQARIARHFGESGIIPDRERAGYEAALLSTARLLNSESAMVVIVAIAFLVSILVGRTPVTNATWAAPIIHGEPTISAAGLWRMLVSQPLLLTLAMSWIWRMAVWTRFLRKIACLELDLVVAHPDHAGGLGFVGTSVPPLAIAAFGLGAWAAGAAANQLLYAGWTLHELRTTAIVVVAVVLLLFAAPTLVLVLPLRRARIRGLLEYGGLAALVGRQFEQLWTRTHGTVNAETLERPDFSAMTDLYQVVTNALEIRVLPIDVRAIVLLAVAALLPMVPALLIVLPVEQALQLVRTILL